MISFKDLKLTDTETMFLIPEPLKPYVLDEIRNANIPYTSVNWRDIPDCFEQAKDTARNRFEAAGYQNTTCMGAILSKLDPNKLFQKCCLFFGPTMDPDFKCMMEEYEKKSHETYETCYKDWLKEGEIPVAAKE